MTQEQIDFLVTIGIDPNADICDLTDQVADYLTSKCLDENYSPNQEAIMCESILDALALID